MNKRSVRKTTIITDPIHQVMNFGSDPDLSTCLKALIDTRAFQRLRRISQLGLASYVFPGATHTRFSHSLGAAYLAHSVLAHLKEWSEHLEQTEIERHSPNVIIAALLHDVGHGPFSHSFEHVLEEYDWAPSHEDWTKTLISNPMSEIYQTLKKYNIVPSTIASVFEKCGSSSLPRPYRQIVSSQLDVDRMDYLIRDSHFAGVAIGRFDAHYLINSTVIVTHGNNKSEKTLGITPKGVKAYEAFLLARQLMNRTVYYHHNVKVLEFMIEQLLRLTIQNAHKLTANRRIGPFVPHYFRKVVQAIRSDSMNKQEFMKQAYDDYVRLTEDLIWTLVSALADSNVVPAAQALAQKLLKRQILPHFIIKTGRKELLEQSLVRAGFSKDVDFHLVDLKTTIYKASGDEHVFVVGWDRNIQEITEHSDTISVFQDRPEAESLLIIMDTNKKKNIERVATERQFVVIR